MNTNEISKNIQNILDTGKEGSFQFKVKDDEELDKAVMVLYGLFSKYQYPIGWNIDFETNTITVNVD